MLKRMFCNKADYMKALIEIGLWENCKSHRGMHTPR